MRLDFVLLASLSVAAAGAAANLTVPRVPTTLAPVPLERLAPVASVAVVPRLGWQPSIPPLRRPESVRLVSRGYLLPWTGPRGIAVTDDVIIGAGEASLLPSEANLSPFVAAWFATLRVQVNCGAAGNLWTSGKSQWLLGQNDYTGETHIDGGVLAVSDWSAAGPVRVESGGALCVSPPDGTWSLSANGVEWINSAGFPPPVLVDGDVALDSAPLTLSGSNIPPPGALLLRASGAITGSLGTVTAPAGRTVVVEGSELRVGVL